MKNQHELKHSNLDYFNLLVINIIIDDGRLIYDMGSEMDRFARNSLPRTVFVSPWRESNKEN